jgi:hypothetical protein
MAIDRANDPARQPEISFPVHRGVFVPGDMHSSNSGVGVHWSASQRTAEEMASYAQNLHPTGEGHQIIHHGSVPISSVESNTKTLSSNAVLSPNNLNQNSEKEVPVKKGAPVLINSRTKATNRNGVWKTRERKYTPPREMKA